MSKRQCPCCGRNRVGPIRTWARNTAYTDPECNKLTSCIHCIREDDYHTSHDWNEYYSSQGYGMYSCELDVYIENNLRQPQDYLKEVQ